MIGFVSVVVSAWFFRLQVTLRLLASQNFPETTWIENWRRILHKAETGSSLRELACLGNCPPAGCSGSTVVDVITRPVPSWPVRKS